jgi:hypothetical protein
MDAAVANGYAHVPYASVESVWKVRKRQEPNRDLPNWVWPLLLAGLILILWLGSIAIGIAASEYGHRLGCNSGR